MDPSCWLIALVGSIAVLIAYLVVFITIPEIKKTTKYWEDTANARAAELEQQKALARRWLGELEEAQDTVSTQADEINELRLKVSVFDNRYASLQCELSTAYEKQQVDKGELDSLRSALAIATDTADRRLAKMHDQEEQINELMEKCQELNSRYRDCEAKLADETAMHQVQLENNSHLYKASVMKSEARMNELTTNLTNANRIASSTAMDNQGLRMDNERLKKELATARHIISEYVVAIGRVDADRLEARKLLQDTTIEMKTMCGCQVEATKVTAPDGKARDEVKQVGWCKHHWDLGVKAKEAKERDVANVKVFIDGLQKRVKELESEVYTMAMDLGVAQADLRKANRDKETAVTEAVQGMVKSLHSWVSELATKTSGAKTT